MKRLIGPLLVVVVFSALVVPPSQADAQAATCNGLRVTIDMSTNGGNGTGTNGPDVILGTAGADTINALGGNDTICAGGGSDIVQGGLGDDVIYGENGHDKLYGAQGADTINGGNGDDTIHGNQGNDKLYGEGGADRIYGYADDDLIEGGDGDDRLHGNYGNDTINGGPGNDHIFGYGDNDVLNGGDGNDLIGGNFGNDTINGGPGNDNLYGSDGSDTVNGGDGNDIVSGNSGDDTIQGNFGNDTLDGGIGFDICVGNGGADTAARCETTQGLPSPTAAPNTPVPTKPVPATPVTATPAPATPVPATPVPATPTSGSGSAQFVETFDNNTGLGRFRTGVYHRDNILVSETQWQGDHDLSCGGPTTSRTIHRDAPGESFYSCKDHLMTSVGDTSGYSIAWFSPNQVFASVTEVCWDVNLTNLGSRQWWKVAVLSVNAPDIMSDKSASDLTGLTGPDRVVASWSGGIGWKGKMTIGSQTHSRNFDAGSDKATRYPGCLRDNQNGTVSFTLTGPVNGGAIGTSTHTVAGSFPDGPLKVVFQDHNYVPTKSDNQVGGDAVQGFTWHWDNIVVR